MKDTVAFSLPPTHLTLLLLQYLLIPSLLFDTFLPSLSSTFLPRQRANQHTISLLTGKPDYQAIAVRSEYKTIQNMVNILPTTTSVELCM